MPDKTSHRPMRRAKREITDPAELHDVVARAHVLRVGFVDDEGMAIVPMNFGVEWDDESGMPTFWLHSAAEGRRAEAWAEGADVALELDVEHGVTTGDYACAYSFAYESVMAWGRVFAVTDAEGKRHGLAAIMAHMAPSAPVTFSDEAVARVAVWRIDVERLTGKRRDVMPAGHPHVAGATPGEDSACPAVAEAAPSTDGAPTQAAPAPASAPEAPRKAQAPEDVIPDEFSGEGERDAEHIGAKAAKRAEKAARKAAKKRAKAERELRHKLAKREAKAKKREKAQLKAAEKPAKHEKGDRKDSRKKALAKALEDKHCSGCGHHCKLASPRCGKGRKQRAKALEKAGL